MEAKDKLCVEDIILLTPGQQIRNIIFQKYTSLDIFAEEIGLYTSSLKQYLKSRKLGSNAFKIKLTQALEMGYDEIVKTEEEQVEKYVNDLSKNIKIYNKKEDILVFEKVKDLCLQYELIQELAMIFRCFAWHYFYRNETDKAIEKMKTAINYMKNKKNHEYMIKYMGELAGIYTRSHKDCESEKLLLEIDAVLKNNNFKTNIMYSVYHNLAVSYFNMKKEKLAVKMYEKSLQYAVHSHQKALSLLGIGMIYKREKKYDLAIKHFNDALHNLDKNDTYINYVYNSFAELFREKKEYEKACFYIDKIFNDVKENVLSILDRFFLTFIQIRVEMGREDEIIEKFFDIIEKNSECIFIYGFVESIEHLIRLEKNNKPFLDKVRIGFIRIIKKNRIRDSRIVEQLKKYIGEINLLQQNHNI